MQLILNNPYRQLGLLVGATSRQENNHKTRINQYLDAEQEIPVQYIENGFGCLGEICRTTQSVSSAMANLNLAEDRISAALFWFWNGNPITDEAALDLLKDGDIEAAYQIWDKLITKTNKEGERCWKPITLKNLSAFHNCSLINLVKSKENLDIAILGQLLFLQSDLIDDFISTVVDGTHKTNSTKLQLLFLNQLLSEIDNKKAISLENFIKIITSSDFVAKQDFLKLLLEKPIIQIEQKIETAKNKRKRNKANGAIAGQELFELTSNDFIQLKSIIGSNDIRYTSIADKVANEMLQCSIDFFNESQEMDNCTDYFETAMNLATNAETIAVGNLTKGRIKDNIKTLIQMKDKELSSAIELLQSVKDAYEANASKINLEVIKAQLELKNNQTIDWDKVSHMIKNSLDWDKVVDLILKVIPNKNIEKIKKSNQPIQIDKYKNLVDFVISKLSFSQVNKVKYICYWKSENITSNAKLTVKSLPLWVKMCLGIAILLLVVGWIWGLGVVFDILKFVSFIGFFVGLRWLLKNI